MSVGYFVGSICPNCKKGVMEEREKGKGIQCSWCGVLVQNLDDYAEERKRDVNTPEPSPTESEHPAVWDLVLEDMKNRDKIGEGRYGTRLQPFNGRDALVDLYQELLDALVYTRQRIYENDAVVKQLKNAIKILDNYPQDKDILTARILLWQVVATLEHGK